MNFSATSTDGSFPAVAFTLRVYALYATLPPSVVTEAAMIALVTFFFVFFGCRADVAGSCDSALHGKQ
jgi:hypothetical protein